jgi:hypothetical protein
MATPIISAGATDVQVSSRNSLPIAAVVTATLALGARALLAERQTVDDVFIFLRYARNLATHGVYSFDVAAHAPRVEGTSSLVWTVALALAYRVGARGLGAAKALSLACGLLLPATCAYAVRRALPERALLAAVPAAALALDADLATWIVSGMDTAAWCLACAGCVALVASGRERAAALLLGALAWLRPEGPLFAAAGVVALASNRRAFLELAALAAAPIVVLAIGRAATFHDVVPNTFWAKMNAADGKDYTGLGYVASAVARRPWLLFVLPLAATHPIRRRPALRVAAALLASSFAFVLIAGGDWMPCRRLLTVALPLASVLAAAAIARARPVLAVAGTLVLAAEAALTFDHAIDQDWREHEWLDERVSRWNVAAHPFVDRYALDWMPAHLLQQIAPYVAPGDTVAHVDVGELPYVMADVAFLDGFGLVDREAGRVVFAPQDPRRRAEAREAFFRARPVAAIVVLDEGTGRPLSPAQDAAAEDARFPGGWREISRVPTWGGHPCVVYVRRDLQARSEATASARIRAWMAAVPDVTSDVLSPRQ